MVEKNTQSLTFDWCMNCDIWIQKTNFDYLCMGPPYMVQKDKKLFFPDITIHTPIESPDRVDNKNGVF
jgi:hypothetical protein